MGAWIPEAYQDYIINQIKECDEQAMCSAQPSTYYNVVRPPIREASTAYDVGDLIHPPEANGFIYECITAGITDVLDPAWGDVQDETFLDGTVLWKSHENYALVNCARVAGDYAVNDYNDPVEGITGRSLTLTEEQGSITHTAGVVSHCALICSTDRTLRYVTEAQTTIGNNTLESGRSTIFYALNIIVTDPQIIS